MRRHSAPQRGGFTLIELLVVLAIIAVLVALIGSAIFSAMAAGPDAQTRHEIAQLATAIEACKSNLSPAGPLPFLPSRIKLDETCDYPNRTVTGSDDWFAVYFLKKAFGNSLNLIRPGNRGYGGGIDWNGDGMATGVYYLDGAEAMVFWLGGIPTATAPAGCRGFNTDPRNPGANGAGTFKQPFYTFPPNRLVRLANNFLRYTDAYNNNPPSPYLYFSTYQAGNDYNINPMNNPPLVQYAGPDCSQSFPTVFPYQTAPGQFINPKSFQILSAGRDGQFGPGGVWPANGWGPNNPNHGSDDLANFSSRILAQPPN
jgi:prepilin-type N-terminal cleavage/methylation domain-containing protein